MIAPTEWPRWLRNHEPVWVVGGAAAVLDAASHLVPAVPSSWHPAVDVVLAVLTLLAQRRLVWSPNSVAELLATQRPPGEQGQPVTPPFALSSGGHVQVLHYPAGPAPDPVEPAP